MKPLPIRLRLTSWYFVMFTTAALLLSLTSWWMLRRTIDTTVLQDLDERNDDVRMQLRQLGQQADMAKVQAKFDAIYRYRDDGKWLQILDQDGHWIYRSPRMAALDSVLPLPQSLLKGGVVGEFTQGTRHVRTRSVPIDVYGHLYSVETGIAMNKSFVLLHTFGISLLLLTPVVLLVAGFGGHVMSRKALAPVADITREARRITERNLNTRLPVSPTEDELSHLSVTLNNMLTRIDTGFRSVRDFTANASHELRTPLALLRTEVEIALLRPRAAAEYRDSLEHMHRVVVDMSELIDTLLTIARADGGSEAMRMLPVDLRSLVADIVEEWSPIASRLSIRLEMCGLHSFDDDRSITILGDRLSILRLLRIWLDNACKFTAPEGAITIHLTPDHNSVLLAVEDTGIGIALEHQGQVFNRFYRVKGDTSRQRAGAGLGLSIAKWIADQHQTSISVDSDLGRGSRFQVRLVRVYDDLSATQLLPDRVRTVEAVGSL
jgi:signal transduction histidine kinase